LLNLLTHKRLAIGPHGPLIGTFLCKNIIYSVLHQTKISDSTSSYQAGTMSDENEIITSHGETSLLPVRNKNYPAFSGLSGARIRVVIQHTGHSSKSAVRLATISSVCQIGDTYYALTAAHIFFDDFNGTES
jgi:hypothetical protein